MQVGPSARHFDDLSLGDEFVTQGRTISDVENSLWTMFTGDMNPMHVDDEFARDHGVFGGRFPAGLMPVSLASGLTERLGLFAGTGLAMTHQTIDYHAAVLIGDTIHVRLTVIERRASTRRAGGTVTFRYEIVRQNGDLCISGEWGILLRSKEQTPS